jgi:hypothetical protein
VHLAAGVRDGGRAVRDGHGHVGLVGSSLACGNGRSASARVMTSAVRSKPGGVCVMGPSKPSRVATSAKAPLWPDAQSSAAWMSSWSRLTSMGLSRDVPGGRCRPVGGNPSRKPEANLRDLRPHRPSSVYLARPSGVRIGGSAKLFWTKWAVQVDGLCPQEYPGG